MVQRLAAAPGGRSSLIAAADTLGRVLVVDGRDMVAVRLLKGYRDAQLAWLALPPLRSSRLS